MVALGLSLIRAELVRRVGKKTNLPLAKLAGIARAGSVPRGVEPVLKNTVCEFACVALVTAGAVSKRGADDGRVIVFPWVPPLCLLASVGVRTLCPVVAPHPWAPLDLISVHSELVGAVYCIVNMVVFRGGLARKLVVGEVVDKAGIDTFQHFSSKKREILYS